MGRHLQNIRLHAFCWIGLFWLGVMISAAMQENRISSQHTEEKTEKADTGPIAIQQKAPAVGISETVVGMTVDELRLSYRRQLGSVEFRPDAEKLEYLLEKSGDNVISFFRDLFNTCSKERVELLVYDRNIPFAYSRRTVEFQYLILPRSGNTETSWWEYRVDKKNQPVDPKVIRGYIMGLGYAGYCLYLHPKHQGNSYFRYLGRDNKLRAHVISFAQKPESGDYLASFYDPYSLMETRFLVQGFLWVSPDNYQVLRMYTMMLSPEKKTVLEQTTTDISYMKVRFDNASREFWLPQEVCVEWDLPAGKFRSRHKYSNYRLFTVESDYKVAQPKVGK